MGKKETTIDEIALDIISNLNGYLNDLKQKGTRRAKKKYLQYAPQVFQMCIDFMRNC